MSGTGETRRFSVKGQSNPPLNQLHKDFFAIRFQQRLHCSLRVLNTLKKTTLVKKPVVYLQIKETDWTSH